MRSNWILDVLTDLKTFARANGMPALAEQLDDTAIVAMTEIATASEAQNGESAGSEAIVGPDIGGLGQG